VKAAPLRVPAERWRAGLAVDARLNLHWADKISGVPGVPSCCPAFTSGTGQGYSFDIIGEIPLTSLLRIGWRAGLTSYNATLRQEIFQEVNYERGIAVGRFEYTVDAEVLGAGLAALVLVEPLDRLFMSVGLRGDYLLSANYQQRETLISPEGILFENGRRVRLESVGQIPEAAALYPSAVGAVRFDLPLNRYETWILAPEIRGSFGLANVLADVPWHMHSVSAGLSLQYIMRRQPELQSSPLDLMVPIESKPAESPGTEKDE
jgi:hypothetical protein